MAIDAKALRIEGIYQQNERGQLMMRVKLAGGLLSVTQAAVLARLGQRYGSGTLHLSTRGSVEFHDLELDQIAPVQRTMATVGLFSRGACGGAVRGISTSSGFGRGFQFTQVLARRLLLYFSGNPHFEGLPKKFKIAVEADYAGSRHLIQDLAFVYVGQQEGKASYDVWAGGGLGRAPQAAILYRQQVPEDELLPLTESIIRVYRQYVEPPKRLKSLIGTKGEDAFRRLVAEALTQAEPVRFVDAFDKTLIPFTVDRAELAVTLPIFAGELPAKRLASVAAVADACAIDYLQVSADQDLVLFPADPQGRQRFIDDLSQAGIDGLDQPVPVCRVCPGNHECRMGLTATRDLAALLMERFGDRLSHRSVAISGCVNSCAQPQLAELGIIASRLVKEANGERTARYDLYRRKSEGLGEKIAEKLTEAELLTSLDVEI